MLKFREIEIRGNSDSFQGQLKDKMEQILEPFGQFCSAKLSMTSSKFVALWGRIFLFRYIFVTLIVKVYSLFFLLF